MEPQRAIESMVRYLTARPDEIIRFVRSGLGMRLGVPLAAFRWILTELTSEAGIDAVLEVDPPGLEFAATLERMRTRMRIQAGLFIQNIDISDQRIALTLRIEGLQIDILSEEKTQLSALIKSGALDLSRPGDLVAELPGIPDVVVKASGTRIELDLMKSERFQDSFLREVVGVMSSLITVRDIRTERTEHVDVSFRTLPRGPIAATQMIRKVVVQPGVAKAKQWARRIVRRTSRKFLISGPE